MAKIKTLIFMSIEKLKLWIMNFQPKPWCNGGIVWKQYITVVRTRERQINASEAQLCSTQCTHPLLGLCALCQCNISVNSGTCAKLLMKWPWVIQIINICSSQAPKALRRSGLQILPTICVLWQQKLHQLCCHPYLHSTILAAVFEHWLNTLLNSGLPTL